MNKKLVLVVVFYITLIPLKSFSQDYNNPVLKSVISPYFSSVDSLEFNNLSFKSIVFSDTVKIKKSKTKWYVRLGRGCLFGTAGAYLGWKITDETRITGNDWEDVWILTLCFAGAGFLIGFFLN